MPIYEYRCTACRHELEAIQKFSEAPLLTCPKCGQATLCKLVSAAGFQLKGSGWYQTDFRNGGKPKAKPATDAGDTKAADSAKSEAAPAASSETAPAKVDTPAAPAPSTPPASA